MIERIVKKKFRSILCLDGDLPDKRFFEEFRIPIIAADGAANKLLRVGLDPDVVIGDLDSFDSSKETLAQIVRVSRQDKSDFQKAADYISEKALFPSLVLGISGGYIDHILNNINIFAKSDFVSYSNGVVCVSLNGDKVGISQNFELPVGTKVSFVGAPKCRVSTSGFKWELSQSDIDFFGESFCFNRTISPLVTISVLRGNCLVFIYTKPIVDAGI